MLCIGFNKGMPVGAIECRHVSAHLPDIPFRSTGHRESATALFEVDQGDIHISVVTGLDPEEHVFVV